MPPHQADPLAQAEPVALDKADRAAFAVDLAEPVAVLAG
jgi:hypothetical protein